MLHYNPQHVSSINMPIFRRTNYIITASGIVTLCKRLYSMPDESRLRNAEQAKHVYQYKNTKIKLYKNNAAIWYNKTCMSLLSSGILHSRLQRAAIPDAVIIQFVLLKMGMFMLETFRGFNPLNAELNPVCHLLALLGAHRILLVSRIRVNVTYILLMNKGIVHRSW
jgi:hypothetical protein